VLANVRSQYGANNAKIVSQWEEWAAEAPQSDDMQEHIEAHPEKF
jgi:ribosomal protein S15P/S13E